MTIPKAIISIPFCLMGLFNAMQSNSQISFDNSASVRQKELLLDTIVTILQTRSIYKDKVGDWDDLKRQLYKSIDYSTSDNAKAIIPAYIKLSGILNITHGGISYEGKSYGGITSGLQEMQSRLRPDIIEAAKRREYNFRTAIINKKYGYISIPPIDIDFSEDMMDKVRQELTKQASIIQDSLCKLNNPGLRGMILDFRLNNGGSFPAMMGGLTSLYDKGLLFDFVMADGTSNEIVKGTKYITFFNDTLVELQAKCPVSKQIRLAILISPYTASAAEQTAISFKGRDNTIFIGESTRGMATGIETVAIRKGLILDYAQCYSKDRKGKIYESRVSPDITIVMGDDFKNLENDKKIQEAIKWFKEKN